MRKLKTGDEVIVISGKDKGKRGIIKKVLVPKKPKYGPVRRGFRVIIEGINMVKKHVKPNPNANIEGGIIPQEAALDMSNVAIWNPALNRADRIGFKYLEDGTKVRYFKANGEKVEI
jgi:large subunit ribosomal protein L24